MGEGVNDSSSTRSAYRVGQRVFGRRDESLPTSTASWGTLCEYVATTRDSLAPFPEEQQPAADKDKNGATTTFEQAAGLATAAQAALQSVAPHVVAGDHVFINGGSGGTGSFAIQIAKSLGCRVTTSCSERNVELCKNLGADEVIVYTREDVTAALSAKDQQYKLVFDTIGSSPADLYVASEAFLKPEGRFVQIGGDFDMGSLGSMMKRAMLPSILGGGKRKFEIAMLKNNPEDLAQVAQMVAEGKLRVVVDDVFPFDKADEAIAKLRTRHARGKVIVKVET